MKKKLLSLLLLGGLTLTAGAQQLPNIGFANWKSASGSTEAFGASTGFRQRPGVEPTDWNGSSVNQKVGLEKKETLIYNENQTVKMQNKYVSVLGIGSVAPGFINLGTPWVYAVAIISECDGGTYGGVAFTHKPDAITGRYKRTDATGETSHIIAYLWSGTFTSNVGSKSSPNQARDNVDRAILGKVTPTASGTLIASCDYTFTSTTSSEWQTITVPLTYHNTTTTPTMMNAIISAGDYWTRANMKDGTTLYADDVKFVYYSTLKTLTYDGVAQTIPAAGETLDMSSVEYDAAKLSYTPNGQTATAQHSYDEATCKLTITVSNVDADVDGQSSHTYYVQFATPQSEPQPEIVSSTDYSDNLVVVINGENTLPQETTINVSKMSDGSYTLSLNDFMLVAGEDMLPVGNIVLEGLTATEENETISFSTNQSILIQPGSTGSAEDWFGPMLGEVPIEMTAKVSGGKMKCEIDIDMTEALGQVINVYFGVVNNLETEALPDAEGVHVVLNRTFQPGWSTLYLQYDVTKEELGAVKVMALHEYDEESQALVFREVVSDDIGGNYPYLVKFDSEKANPFFANRVVWNSGDSRMCGSWLFTGTFTGIAAPGMEGKYGVTVAADGYQYIRRGGKNASIKGTRAFFEYHGEDQGVQQMRIRIEGEDGVTSIDGVETVIGSFDIYNLQGIRVRTAATSLEGLTPGVYVVNGKKVMVK